MMIRDILTERLERGIDDSDLIEAIWEARRQNRTDLRSLVLRLLDHSSPVVREEALNLLAVKWRDRDAAKRARVLFQADPDFGVRSAAAWGFAVLSTSLTHAEDVALLRTAVLNPRENPHVRDAAYQALCRVAGKPVPQLKEGIDIERNADLDWVRSL